MPVVLMGVHSLVSCGPWVTSPRPGPSGLSMASANFTTTRAVIWREGAVAAAAVAAAQACWSFRRCQRQKTNCAQNLYLYQTNMV